MQLGVVFPQTEIGNDPGAIRDYAQTAEGLGYHHLLAFDHVLGAHPSRFPGGSGRAYTHETPFHEPFVLFGYLAAATSRLELVTGVLVLPQRQTALVAKQAAEVDLLSAGRLRFGIGIGWNAVEYEALGQDFGTRGKRSAEQIQLLRRLWTEQTVTFDGAFDKVTGAGLAPLPVQRPIPIWIGAASAPGYRRAGRLADGWFPMMEPGPQLDEALAKVARGAAEAGRDPAVIGMEARVSWQGDDDDAAARIAAWAEAGATHLSVNTMGAGLTSVDEHLDVLARMASSLPN